MWIYIVCLYNAVTICPRIIITLQHAAALYHGEGEVCGRGGGLQFNIHVLFLFSSIFAGI